MRTINCICTCLRNLTWRHIFKLTFETFCTKGNNVTRGDIFTTRPLNFNTINNGIYLFCRIVICIRTTTDGNRVIKVSTSAGTNSYSISNRFIINNLAFIIHTSHTVSCSTNCNTCITGKSTCTIGDTSMSCCSAFIVCQIIAC